MNRKLRWLRKAVTWGLILVCSVAAGYYLANDVFKSASSIIAGFAGLAVTALIPTMLWAATALHPNFKGLVEFNKYREAIYRQLAFFSGLFFMIMLLGAVLIAGGILGWKETITTVSGSWLPFPIEVNWMKILNGLIVALLTVVGVRFISLIDAVFSLFNFHADSIERQIKARLLDKDRETLSMRDLPTDPRKNFGKSLGKLSEPRKPH